MSQQTHIIRRQLVEVHLPPGTDSHAVQERVSRICREVFTALLDEYLSRYAGPDKVQLTRLEIDLGTIALADLELTLPQRLAHELERVLPPAVLAAAGPAVDQRNPSNSSDKPGKTLGSDTDLIAYFLRFGLLPWWATPVSSQRLADAFARAQRQDARALKRLLTNILDEPAATARLFYSCADTLLEQLLGLWLPAPPPGLQGLKAALLGPQGAIAESVAGRQAWWYGLFKTATHEGVAAGHYDAPAIYHLLSRFLAAKADGIPAAALPGQDTLALLAEVFSLGKAISAPTRAAMPGLPAPLEPAKPAALEDEGGRADTTESSLRRPPFSSSAPSPAETLLQGLAPGQPGPAATSRILPLGRADTFSDSDKIGIRNAGLVLLWPFLPRFFAALGLTSEGRFPDADAATRACLMLQYLAEGTTDDVFEAALPLNKLLCGLALGQPLPTAWVIRPEEASAATTLLEAVIQNGPLWRTVSVEGFRQAFLQREGLLSTRDGHWLLQAARETHDIIIDRLPWAVRHVKLPWMERLIFVEWQQA
ncbi:contractile injection system tape measure protein [Hymenobacter convexus]|uniref:contractile injection system tape measure protein n=1 Tax=Hymenobacter sp. CA1UV-4 TaxID=3063782 RepID=UPI0027136B32|nr:contractile injection system tape measure protein [Hymenobacter sp. CA1UV-4]MDO7854098.1 contractile injection system tape measure protein [Hymenobacter sp. CA1UV-4]